MRNFTPESKSPRMLVLATALAAAAATAPLMAGSAEEAAFERIRGLAGTWTGSNSHGHPVELSFDVVAAGSAVVERLTVQRDAGDEEMVTVYHLDGDRLMLTHYCVAGNQPRMVARALDADGIGFEMVDATGLASPEAGHMHRARLDFRGDGALRSEWTWREEGEEPFTAIIDVVRTPDQVAAR